MTSSSSANIPRARVLGSFEKRERTSQGTSFTTTCHIEARVSAVIICGRRRILSPLKQLSLRANMAKLSKWVYERGCSWWVRTLHGAQPKVANPRLTFSIQRGPIKTFWLKCVKLFCFIWLSLSSVALQMSLGMGTILYWVTSLRLRYPHIRFVLFLSLQSLNIHSLRPVSCFRPRNLPAY